MYFGDACATEAEIEERFNKILVFGAAGTDFGPAGDMFYRIEIGINRHLLEEVVRRIVSEFA